MTALLAIVGVVWGALLLLAWCLVRVAAMPTPQPPSALRDAEAVAAGAWFTEGGA